MFLTELYCYALPHMKNNPHTVFLVDDHPIVRKGLVELINQVEGLTVCAEASDGVAALEILKKTQPDIILIDLSLKGMSGLDLIGQISDLYPELPMLVLSMLEESLYAERALRAGARGYVMKQEGTEKLIQSIWNVLKGDISVSEDVSSKMLTRLTSPRHKKAKNPIETFSNRELEIFQLIGQGLGTRAIAEKLFLSVKPVETHREHIKEKLNLNKAPELIRQAVQWVTKTQNT